MGLVCERTGTTEIRPSSCSGVRGCGMIGCTARMRESLKSWLTLFTTQYINWASDHYALVRGRFTITKSGKRVPSILIIYRTKKAYSRHNRSRQTRLVDQVKQSLVIPIDQFKTHFVPKQERENALDKAKKCERRINPLSKTTVHLLRKARRIMTTHLDKHFPKPTSAYVSGQPAPSGVSKAISQQFRVVPFCTCSMIPVQCPK